MGISSSTQWLLDQGNDPELKSETPQKENPDYLTENTEIPVAKFLDKPGYLYLDITSTSFIGMFGPSGSGKTTADMSIATRTYQKNRKIANLADTDLHTTNLDKRGGVSKQLVDAMGLVEGEKPTEIPQKTLLPKYLFNKLNEMPGMNVPSNVEKFTLGFKDVNQSELKFLLGNGLDTNQKMALQSVLSKLDTDNLTFEKIYDALEEADDINYQVADKIKRNVQVLEDTEIISSSYTKDIPKLIDDGYSIGLGMKGFDNLDKDDYYLMEFYAKKVSEKIINARNSNQLDFPLFFLFPEAHHLMPRERTSILADHVKRISTYYGRRADIPLILDSQNPSQISVQLLDELNHVFLGCDANGKPIAKSEWQKVLNKMSLVSNANKEYMEWAERIQELSHREFLYISPRMSGAYDAERVEFLAPLTCNP